MLAFARPGRPVPKGLFERLAVWAGVDTADDWEIREDEPRPERSDSEAAAWEEARIKAGFYNRQF